MVSFQFCIERTKFNEEKIVAWFKRSAVTFVVKRDSCLSRLAGTNNLENGLCYPQLLWVLPGYKGGKTGRGVVH